MKNINLSRTLLSVVLVGGLCGCVPPDGIDAGLLSRYQQAIAGRGPQERAGREGLQLLRPKPATKLPELPVEVVKDAKTGKITGRLIRLALDEAITRALANSVDIEVVSYDPAIAREEMVKAAAEFDLVMFGGYSYEKADQRTGTVLMAEQDKKRRLEAGLRQKTVTGATWALTWAMTRSWDDSAFRMLQTRHEPTLALEVTQPLLRDAWPGFNLAKLMIARINHRITMAAFRQKVEEIVTEVITTYWALAQARCEYEIQKRLLERTEQTFKKVKGRVGLDAKPNVEVRQAEAAVASRQAGIVRARRLIIDVQDRLARLLADPQINVLSDLEGLEIVPKDQETIPKYVDQAGGEKDKEDQALLVKRPIIDAKDQLLASVSHNPVLQQARLAIAAGEINVKVAANQRLPKLDLALSAGLQGLGGTRRDAFSEFHRGDYLSYGLGLSLEYPPGNRERQAELRLQRLARRKAVSEMQNIADQIAVAVGAAIRRIYAAYDEMQSQDRAAKSLYIQLRGLEDFIARTRMSPELLQTELQTQESLAIAERAVAQAVVDFHTARAELERVTGTALEMHRVQLAPAAGVDDKDLPLHLPPDAPAPARVKARQEKD